MAFKTLCLLLSSFSVARSLSLTPGDEQSVKETAGDIAGNLMKNWGENTLLPNPYYWWEAGALWGGMVDYWAYTGDTRFESKTASAIASQQAPTEDFMMMEQRGSLGNDDQGFWGLAAMSAAEYGLPVPEGNPSDLWLTLGKNTFQRFTERWDTSKCQGGLKWQIFPENKGYNYRNTISTGTFFQLAARLARYTGNGTYGAWADKSWWWMEHMGLIDEEGHVYDGAGEETDCKEVSKAEWSYNAGMLAYGAAAMWDVSAHQEEGRDKWSKRTNLIIDSALGRFFHDDVMYEYMCEVRMKCNNDQWSFKAYLSRWLVKSVVLHEDELADKVMPLISKSAVAAAQSCDGDVCGSKWWTDAGYDGTTGPGQMMSAMETVTSLLGPNRGKPTTRKGLIWGSQRKMRRFTA